MVTFDAYAARSCPLKPLYAMSDIARPPAVKRVLPPGVAAFRDQVAEGLLAGPGRVTDLRMQGIAATTAMEQGADVVIGGQLPDDEEEHRCGWVPLLVRDPDGGYRPVLIRFQRILQAGESLSYSSLDTPMTPATLQGHSYRWLSRFDNAIQLAHYWRMLDRLGYACATPTGGVVGLDDLGDGPAIAWVPLTSTDEAAAGGDVPDTLGTYDREFAALVEVAGKIADGATAETLNIEPARTRECEWCDWWPACEARLPADDFSVRLPLSHLNRPEILILRDAGVRSVADLGACDVDGLLETAFPASDHPTGLDARLRTAQHRARLIAEGVELERTSAGPISLPRAALEIDIDLETSREDRVYLWGFWITDTETSESGYHPFAAFEHLDDASEIALARTALRWLRELVEGRDALVYHYSDYETIRIARLAGAAGDAAITWADQWAREHFVDLFPLVKSHFFGAHGLGLKVVAHAGAGFSWRDPDPGGLNSMKWFEEALSAPTPEARDAARRRVLEYNEDDVRATAELRRWLRTLDEPG